MAENIGELPELGMPIVGHISHFSAHFPSGPAPEWFAAMRGGNYVRGLSAPSRGTGPGCRSGISVTSQFEELDVSYVVLVNDAGQRSLWPVFADVPAGWRVGAATGGTPA